MHHCSPQIFDTQSGKSHSVFNVGGFAEHQNLETIRSPFNIMSPLQTSPAWTSFHQLDPQIGVPTSFPLQCHKSSGDNSTFTTIQCPSVSQFSFTNSLHSIVESFLSSSEESFPSSDMHSGFPSDSDKYTEFIGHDEMSLYDQSQQNDEMRGDGAVEDVKPLEISFHRNLQSDKQCSRACAPDRIPSSINSISRSSQTRKRRIRWTKDLHEPFVMIVDCLGGPEKAKPKSILKMMDSDMLTISHIKSHLQKYRSTICMRKDLQERSGEGNQPEGVSKLQLEIHKQIEESLQLQREVQRSLHEQLEIQENLQLLIKQHRQQLKKMSDHQKQGSKLPGCSPE